MTTPFLTTLSSSPDFLTEFLLWGPRFHMYSPAANTMSGGAARYDEVPRLIYTLAGGVFGIQNVDAYESLGNTAGLAPGAFKDGPTGTHVGWSRPIIASIRVVPRVLDLTNPNQGLGLSIGSSSAAGTGNPVQVIQGGLFNAFLNFVILCGFPGRAVPGWDLCISRAGGPVTTVTLSGVPAPVINRNYLLQIEYQPNVSVKASIDGVVGATITAGLPDTTARMPTGLHWFLCQQDNGVLLPAAEAWFYYPLIMQSGLACPLI